MISVIIPIYNGEKYLKRCLDSLVEQTYKEYEVVMVDDGSVDKTFEICKQYVSRDERFIYLHKINGGVGSARNYGISKARGDFITFVDADDFVKKNYLGKLVDGLQGNKCDICYCSAIDCNSLGIPQEVPSKDCSIRIFESCDYDWMDFIDGHFTVWGGIYKKNLVQEIRFSEDLHVGEDTLWIAEILNKKIKICSLREKLYYYCILPDSAAHSKFSNMRYDEIVAWGNICKMFRNKNNSTVAYAVRIQIMFDTYKRDGGFSKNICQQLFKEHRKCIKSTIFYWVSKGKIGRAHV